jgi:hypothetical protein
MYGDEREVSRITSIAVATLRTWRVRGGGPPYIKANRSVKYDLGEVDAWMRARRAVSTTDADRQAARAKPRRAAPNQPTRASPILHLKSNLTGSESSEPAGLRVRTGFDGCPQLNVRSAPKVQAE